MRPRPARAATALVACLAFATPAGAQDIAHQVVVEPLTLRLQSGPTTFSAGTFFMGLAVDGRVPAPPTPYTSATITKPDSSIVNLSQFSPNLFISEFQFPTLAALQAAYPGGTYGGAIAPNGPVLPTVALPDNYVLPVFPAFTNYDAIRAMDPQQPFTFTFTAFGAPTGLNSMALAITETATGNLVLSEQLTSDATQYTLPAGTLDMGRAYTANLYFIEIQGFGFTIDELGIHVAQASVASANVAAFTATPEPSVTLALAAAGLAAVIACRRRKLCSLPTLPRDES